MTDDYPRCQHRSEVGDLQCLSPEHSPTQTHVYSGCSFCSYTYEPCPILGGPCGRSARGKAELAARARYRDGSREMHERWAELPDWAQDALRRMGWKVDTP